MIARTWHGWAGTPEDASAYETHFRTAVLPELQQVDGFVTAQLLRREHGGETEFVAVTWFRSLAAVRGFAGDDYQTAVVEPAARQALTRFDTTSAHYEVVARADETATGTTAG